MKKTIVFGLAIWLGGYLPADAQVILNLQLPPTGLSVKPQLWNMSLINSGSENMSVQIEVVVTDANTGQPVLSGVSNMFLLPKGVKQVRAADVMPVTYNAGNAGYAVDPRPDGFLPTGVFTICYSVLSVSKNAPEKLSEECETVQIEPISPPQLIIPADNEQVAVTRPVFTWLPPAPVTLNGVQYDWVLVEVQATQSAADAVQQNIPVFSRQNVSFTSFQYPLSMPELDTAKLYAWRITAKNKGMAIGNSEVWSFRVRKNNSSGSQTDNGSAFAQLHRSEDAAYVICNGLLRFAYDNEYNAGVASLKITDISSATRKPVSLDSADYTIHYGQNFIQVALDQNKAMKNGHMYLMELTNEKQEKWYLKFEFEKAHHQVTP